MNEEEQVEKVNFEDLDFVICGDQQETIVKIKLLESFLKEVENADEKKLVELEISNYKALLNTIERRLKLRGVIEEDE